MPETFTYKVRDQAGKLVEGSLEADERAARRQQAALDGLRAHRDRAAGRQRASASDLKIPGLSDRVKLKDVAVFSRQFATMINSGLSLLRSLVHPRRADREQGARRGRRTRCASTSRRARRSRPRWRSTRRRSTASTSRWCSAGEVGGVLDSVLHAPRRHDREAGRAAPQGEVGDDLSRSSSRVLVLRHRDRDAAVHHPDVRGHLHASSAARCRCRRRS